MKTKHSEVSTEKRETIKSANIAKKLLISLLIVSGFAYADCNDPANAGKAVTKLHKWNKTAIQVNYTSDKTNCADTCKTNILALDKSINVTKKLVSGTGVCKFSKPN